MVAAVLYRVFEVGGSIIPERKRVRVERRMRGWFEDFRLRRADAAVVSFGKSGRTWLRVMLSRAYAKKYGLDGDALLRFGEFKRKSGGAVPAILFTHDNYLGDYTGHGVDKADYDAHKVVLLVRDPADTAVSQYFQWRHRMRRHKKIINDYPRVDGDALSMFDFVMGEQAGLPKVIRFMNQWAEAIPRLPHGMVLRYEDLRDDTAGRLREVLAFLGTPASDDEIADAVEYARLENMRQREADGSVDSRRLRAADKSNPDSFKARRAKVGGYRDYFDADQVRAMDELIASTLSPVFGYERRAPVEAGAPSGAAGH